MISQGFRRVRRKTPLRRGGGLRPRWRDAKGNLYEWDYQHGTLEKYNKRGMHLGEYDPLTGVLLSPANLTRSINP